MNIIESIEFFGCVFLAMIGIEAECFPDGEEAFTQLDEAEQKVWCRNMELEDYCAKFDEGYDPTYGLPALDHVAWRDRYFFDKRDDAKYTPEIERLLEVEDYQSLNTYFNALQDDCESGKTDEYECLRLFGKLRYVDDSLEDRLSAWIAHSPEEFVGYAASGFYFVGKGWEVRGAKSASKTPNEDMQKMRDYMGIARPHLEKALAIRNRFLVGHERLIRLSYTVGDADEKTEAYLAEALKISPAAFLPRRAHMFGLEPRWGGSHLRLRKLAESAQEFVTEQPLLRELLAHEWKDRAVILYHDENWEEAANAYTNALHHSLDSDWLGWRAKCYEEIKNFDAEIADRNMLVEMWPDWAAYRVRRGHAYIRANKLELARADFTKATELSPEDDANWHTLGWFHFYKQIDFSKAAYAYRKTLEVNPENTDAKHMYAWTYIERHDSKGLTFMREYVELCKTVACESGQQDWAEHWLRCVDDSGQCSMPKSDYVQWRGKG